LNDSPQGIILFGMQIHGRVVIVTGGSNGIGRALCHKFASAGAKAVVVVDIDLQSGQKVAGEIGSVGEFMPCNVANEQEVKKLVDSVAARHGQIDIFCSNAGVGTAGGPEASDKDWQRSWDVNLMAHVYAARAVLPQMLARKEGYLVQTVSAAGLLTQIGSAPYSVSKHAAMSFAEWLSVTYGDQGIRVSALCPMGVKTQMLARAEFSGGAFLLETAMEPEQVADETIKVVGEERFLILPHPDVARFFQQKASDYDRWLRGMRRLQANTQILTPKV